MNDVGACVRPPGNHDMVNYGIEDEQIDDKRRDDRGHDGDEDKNETETMVEEAPEQGGEEDEEPKAIIMTDPGKPTAKEIEEHRVFHIPYRSWCPQCVRGRGKEDHHKRVDRTEQQYPLISKDYAFMNGTRREEVVVEKEDPKHVVYRGGRRLFAHYGAQAATAEGKGGGGGSRTSQFFTT